MPGNGLITFQTLATVLYSGHPYFFHFINKGLKLREVRNLLKVAEQMDEGLGVHWPVCWPQ